MILRVEQGFDELVEQIKVKLVRMRNENILECRCMFLVFVRQWKYVRRSMAFEREQDCMGPLVKETGIGLCRFLRKGDPKLSFLCLPVAKT